jgi:hypothetical protein
MQQRRMPILWSIILIAAAATWAASEPTKDQLALQRHQLEDKRKNPEIMTRLRKNLAAFDALDEANKARIIKLDEQLRQEPVKAQTRVWNVLERYVDWLERLPEEDRQKVIKTTDPARRLAVIHALRDQEWMRFQPKPFREIWTNLEGPDRAKYVKEKRNEELRRHHQWQLAARFWTDLEGKKPLPGRLSDYSEKVQHYVKDYLMVLITEEEKQQLARAEGHWPEYPQTLVAIASRYPSALPPPRLPMQPDKLPAPVLARVTEKKGGSGKSKLIVSLRKAENREEFASMVVLHGTKKGNQPFEFEFWACNHHSLLAPMKDFVDKTLKPVLNNTEKKALFDSEGTWPYYPETIKELSEKHHLRPPWHILPEADKWKWDRYRQPN